MFSFEVCAKKVNLVCEINKELCTRCGTCAGVCPKNCFIFDDKNYPRLIYSKCVQCGLCTRICPGSKFNTNFFSQKLFGKNYNPNDILGNFMVSYVGYALDENLRRLATSGGIATAILICLLEQKMINGAIVTVPNYNNPEISEPIIALTKDTLLSGAQSKYTIVPVNKIFKELGKIDGKFALVGLPCHVQAFRKLSENCPSLASKISVVIGLYCGRTMEQEATLSLIRMLGIKLTQLRKIQYRGGNWPGEFRAYLKNGTYFSCHKDIYMYLNRLYCTRRCLLCIDYSAEFADISLADAWTIERNTWKYPGGQTIVLVRTKPGLEVLNLVKNKGYVKLQEISRETAIETHRGISSIKKKGAMIRITWLKNRGKQYPDYGVLFFDYSWRDILGEIRRSSGIAVGQFFLSRKLIESFVFILLREYCQIETKSKAKRVFLKIINFFMKKWFDW
ncbi:MAG: Coenzyme F420 hydrogenase/dehydrogenase, beta subunit C-terminal domain [Candidatus Bathyarchaeia archaeon]